MAKIRSGNLSLDIKFKRFEDEWIAYEISFLWRDEIIVNDKILKKNRWWEKRIHGTFLANDYEKDFLIETIKKTIETNKPEYWEPIEPDVKIAIYPEEYFPFLKSHWVPVEEVDEKIAQIREQLKEQIEGQPNLSAEKIEEQLNILEEKLEEQLKVKLDVPSEDEKLDASKYELFTIIAFIDTYNFEDSKAYSGEGISLHLIVTRRDLERFVTDLEEEYSEFLGKH